MSSGRCAGAKIVVLRMLGGAGYWPYGVDEPARRRAAARQPVRVPAGRAAAGTRRLPRAARVDAETRAALWRYLRRRRRRERAARAALCRASDRRGAERPAAGARRCRPAGLLAGRARAGAIGPTAAVAVLSRAGARAARPRRSTRCDGAASARASPRADLRHQPQGRALGALSATRPSRRYPPDVVLNATAFADRDRLGTRRVLARRLAGAAGRARRLERGRLARRRTRGLSPRDLTMNVVLPEVDGRIFTQRGRVQGATSRADAASRRPCRVPLPDRVAAAADLAAAWVRLRRTPARRAARRDRPRQLSEPRRPPRQRRRPRHAGERCGDPARRCGRAGYDVGDAPRDARGADAAAADGPDQRARRPRDAKRGGIAWPVDAYAARLRALPEGSPRGGRRRAGARRTTIRLSRTAPSVSAMHRFGNVVVGIQPARGYNIDPKATYHDPDLVPPHDYLAFYALAARARSAPMPSSISASTAISNGCRARRSALSATCWPEACSGAMPHHLSVHRQRSGRGHPGQAPHRGGDRRPPDAAADPRRDARDRSRSSRRWSTNIALAAGVDPARATHLARRDPRDCRRARGSTAISASTRGRAGRGAARARRPSLRPEGDADPRRPARLRRVAGRPAADRHCWSRSRACRARTGGRRTRRCTARIAADLGLGDFDPLDGDLGGGLWTGRGRDALAAMSDAPWRTHGDTVERIELLARLGRCVVAADDPAMPTSGDWTAARAAGRCATWIDGTILRAVADRPTSRRAPRSRRAAARPRRPFRAARSVRRADARAAGRAADRAQFLLRRHPRRADRGGLGARPAAAERWSLRYFQDEGEWPRSIALSAWGTSNMRTGGDDIAQALALIGARAGLGAGHRPRHRLRDHAARRARPPARRRDAPRSPACSATPFPAQIDLFDSAVRAVAALDEPDDANPIAAAIAATRQARAPAIGRGARGAPYRVFGSKPGAYGAGLQALIDEGGWETRARSRRGLSRLGRLCLWRRRARATAARDASATRLAAVDASSTIRTTASTTSSTPTTTTSSRAASRRRSRR